MQSPVEGACIRFSYNPLPKGLNAASSRKCHEMGLPLGKENLNSAGSVRMTSNILRTSGAISIFFHFPDSTDHIGDCGQSLIDL